MDILLKIFDENTNFSSMNYPVCYFFMQKKENVQKEYIIGLNIKIVYSRRNLQNFLYYKKEYLTLSTADINYQQCVVSYIDCSLYKKGSLLQLFINKNSLICRVHQ